MLATIDPTTFNEVSLRTIGPAGRWTETRFSDYRKVGSLNVAYVQEQWDNGGLESTTRITDVVLEPGLIGRFFKMPTNPNLGYLDFVGGLAVLQAREAAAGNKGLQPAGARP
jgi:hypothetical protein